MAGVLIPVNSASPAFVDEPLGLWVMALSLSAFIPNCILIYRMRGFSPVLALPHIPPWLALLVLLAWQWPDGSEAYVIYLAVLVTTNSISLCFDVLETVRWWKDARGTKALPEMQLLERIPPEKHGALLYLRMQDHYVEIVTDKGHSLVLMRWSDALSEIPSGIGMQIHRSYWISFDAVADWRNDVGKLSLVLTDKTELPVSRSRKSDVLAAGFLNTKPQKKA